MYKIRDVVSRGARCLQECEWPCEVWQPSPQQDFVYQIAVAVFYEMWHECQDLELALAAVKRALRYNPVDEDVNQLREKIQFKLDQLQD